MAWVHIKFTFDAVPRAWWSLADSFLKSQRVKYSLVSMIPHFVNLTAETWTYYVALVISEPI